MSKASMYPCPICGEMMCVIGVDKKGKKITSCGHRFSFKRSRSKKESERKYVRTPWGLELA